MARPARPDPFAGASSWAPLSPEGESDARAEAGQLPLFDAPRAPASPSAPARPARLRGRLQALLARSAALAGETPREARPPWPDSFFDADGQP